MLEMAVGKRWLGPHLLAGPSASRGELFPFPELPLVLSMAQADPHVLNVDGSGSPVHWWLWVPCSGWDERHW